METEADIEALTAPLPPISLDEMSSIRLMNRIDRKFLTSIPTLVSLLGMARNDYMVQEIDGLRNMPYSTVYFDTPDYDMFCVHQAGHTGRQKLRFRTYVSSNLQFMEVKTKNNHGRTRKKRMTVTDMNLSDLEKEQFLAQHLRYSPGSLLPALQNSFNRITLVNRAKTERLTIDTGLQFYNLRTGQSRNMGPLVIIELKRDGLCPSPVFEMLRRLHVKPHGFSKYCMGTVFTSNIVRVNRFKSRVRDVERILEGRSPQQNFCNINNTNITNNHFSTQPF